MGATASDIPTDTVFSGDQPMDNPGLYQALGSKLMALTSHCEIDPATDTYFQRTLGRSRTPWALFAGFTFTL